jgi:hypothetical protein
MVSSPGENPNHHSRRAYNPIRNAIRTGVSRQAQRCKMDAKGFFPK